MKKIKWIVGIVVVSAAIAHVSIQINQIGMPDMTTQNVEALARGESDYIICAGTGNVICPTANLKVRAVLQ